MILTKAYVVDYMKRVVETNLHALKREFEVYDNDKNKAKKLDDILLKLEKAKIIAIKQVESAELSIFGQAIVKALNLPTTAPKFVYIGG
jgi:hypothetical protein